jgi:hypothetical protein
MGYLLPRAAIIVIAWGVTCGLIRSVSSNVNPVVFLIAAVIWTCAGVVCFGYLRRLRRQDDVLRERGLSIG